MRTKPRSRARATASVQCLQLQVDLASKAVGEGIRHAFGEARSGGLAEGLGECAVAEGDVDLADTATIDLEAVDGEGVEQLVGEDAAHDASEGQAAGRHRADSCVVVRCGADVEGGVAQGAGKAGVEMLRLLEHRAGEQAAGGAGFDCPEGVGAAQQVPHLLHLQRDEGAEEGMSGGAGVEVAGCADTLPGSVVALAGGEEGHLHVAGEGDSALALDGPADLTLDRMLMRGSWPLLALLRGDAALSIYAWARGHIALTPSKGDSYTEARATARRRDAMRSAGLIVAGGALFVLGLLVRTDLVTSTLNTAGVLAIVVGAAIFAAGVFFLARDKV